MNIDRDYCVMMGRYNAWQNRQLRDLLQTLGPEELVKDRGAFFGSILGTLSHLVWGDQIWMSRFDGGAAPELAGTESTVLVTTFDAWSDAREQMDARIGQWAAALNRSDLAGNLSWYSGAQKCDVSQPLAACAVHMFNHQTHHRGQVHAMMTAAGIAAPVSDLVFMPEDAA